MSRNGFLSPANGEAMESELRSLSHIEEGRSSLREELCSGSPTGMRAVQRRDPALLEHRMPGSALGQLCVGYNVYNELIHTEMEITNKHHLHF